MICRLQYYYYVYCLYATINPNPILCILKYYYGMYATVDHRIPFETEKEPFRGYTKTK